MLLGAVEVPGANEFDGSVLGSTDRPEGLSTSSGSSESQSSSINGAPYWAPFLGPGPSF